jgi:PqqD family protein of HPr-rel-A system
MAESVSNPTDPAAVRFKCVPLGAVVAAYDRHSGRTHVLDPLTAAVLEERSLRSTATDGEALRWAVATRLGIGPDELTVHQIAESLAQLQSAGLA